MHACRTNGWEPLAVLLGGLAACVPEAPALGATSASPENEIRIVQIEGVVEVSTDGGRAWVRTQTNQVLSAGYRMRTGPNSRATLHWSDQSLVPFGALTELEILPPHEPQALTGMRLLKGIISFFHRDKPGRIQIITRGATAGIEGTEFVLAVDDAETTTLSLIDGKVRFGNEQATLVLTNGQRAVAELGRPPTLTAGFVANNILQWCFYYPAVLDLSELPLTTDEQTALAESLRAYRAGDLLDALTKYPAGRAPGSDAERVYYAALVLSVGQVDQTESVLTAVRAGGSERLVRVADALAELIAAVKLQTNSVLRSPELSSELLAASYYEQSRGVLEVSLEKALDLARQATVKSPDFGFAWARVADLEFSFGRTSQALEALDRSLALAPRNAQALALKGFLVAAKNRAKEATKWFDDALAVDPGLGNAWLGRGLCRIRRGDLAGGREDLLVAAAIEPRRALLRSYLGKADAEKGDYPRATKELQHAKELDPNDPTAWLYSALLNQQYNRINEAVHDLEESQALNDNRSVYRSSLLLDEDRAVRSANLAAIYRDAGMFDVSVREAARAVNYDYANYSAHLFLANSYLELSDPNLINLRYETPAENEYLLANLLAPVGAGTLSPTISQQEYSKLFERDRLGLISSTEYLSRGAWTESGAQYGTFGNFSYSFDAFYHSDPGQRPNNDVEQRQLSISLKGQFTPTDSVYFQALHYDATGGDLAQYFDQSEANPGFRFHEKEEPILALGYHHEWSPGVDTLFLAARLSDTLSLTNPAQPTLLNIAPLGSLTAVNGLSMQQDFTGELEIYSAELQQIWQRGGHTTILGGRVQWGDFRTGNLQTDPSRLVVAFPDPPTPAADQDFTVGYLRTSVYAYHYWRVSDPLELVGGVAYDRIKFPENFRFAPISDAQQTVDEVLPKAGFILTPSKSTTIRFAYSRSLSGASLDQSYQLEPSQVAGFIQSYRSIIPESVSGPNAGAKLETFGLSLEQKLPTRTYLGVAGEIQNSQVRRTVGAFNWDPVTFLPATPSGLREDLNYTERSVTATLNQLVGNGWSLGARYRLTDAQLMDEFPDAQNLLFFDQFEPTQETKSLLHQADLFAIYNHPWGWFAEFDALWYKQTNENLAGSLPGEEFWQFNAFVGYRSPRRRLTLTVGVLNLTDRDYRLNPLTLYNDLPRSRTAVVNLVISF